MKLAELMSAFSDYLYGDEDQRTPLQKSLASNTPVAPETGLNIYRQNLIFSAVDALATTYVTIQKALTPENFRYFAKCYLEDHPSVHPDLGALTQNFPAYLSQRPELQALSWLSDLGRLEWSWERLEAEFPGNDNVLLNPTLNLLSAEYPVLDLWTGIDEIVDSGELPQPRQQLLVLWNFAGKNYIQEVSASQFELLRNPLKGDSEEIMGQGWLAKEVTP